MEDPTNTMEQQMAETAEVLALRASVREGQRLLRLAIKERNLARSEAARQLSCRESERAALRQVTKTWCFALMPREVKDFVRRMLGGPL